MFLAGKGADAGLCIIKASAEAPAVSKLTVETKPGLFLGMPECVTALSGKEYAMAFQSKRAGDAAEQLTIIDLDPNQDRDFADAKVESRLRLEAVWLRDIDRITRLASMMTRSTQCLRIRPMGRSVCFRWTS